MDDGWLAKQFSAERSQSTTGLISQCISVVNGTELLRWVTPGAPGYVTVKLDLFPTAEYQKAPSSDRWRTFTHKALYHFQNPHDPDLALLYKMIERWMKRVAEFPDATRSFTRLGDTRGSKF